jgi:hypothetical protein
MGFPTVDGSRHAPSDNPFQRFFLAKQREQLAWHFTIDSIFRRGVSHQSMVCISCHKLSFA